MRRYLHLLVAVICLGLGLAAGAGAADLAHLVWPTVARPLIALPLALPGAWVLRACFYRFVMGVEQ